MYWIKLLHQHFPETIIRNVCTVCKTMLQPKAQFRQVMMAIVQLILLALESFFHFSLYFISNGPKIVCVIYVHVLREMYKRCRLFKRSKRLRGSCSRILSMSDWSVFVWFPHVSVTLSSAHEVTPARLVSILMFAIEGEENVEEETVKHFKIWFQTLKIATRHRLGNLNFPFAFTSKFNVSELFYFIACISCSDWHNLVQRLY